MKYLLAVLVFGFSVPVFAGELPPTQGACTQSGSNCTAGQVITNKYSNGESASEFIANNCDLRYSVAVIPGEYDDNTAGVVCVATSDGISWSTHSKHAAKKG